MRNLISNLVSFLAFVVLIVSTKLQTRANAENSNLFKIYIGADFKNVKFTDVPINPNVETHFILSFAIDYTTNQKSPSPTNGQFNVFWDAKNLAPDRVASIKRQHSNVKVSLSLGGDSVGDNADVVFTATSIESWVKNAVASVTRIIKQLNLDGIDIDYEHFSGSTDTFAECIGQLITTLKKNRVITSASIAPFDNPDVQRYYLVLWRKYSQVIDEVNFQFYAYDKSTTIPQFLKFFEVQTENYKGGKVLVSYISDERGGLFVKNGFFTACNMLKSQNQLNGIFGWYADDSKKLGFRFEKQANAILASA